MMQFVINILNSTEGKMLCQIRTDTKKMNADEVLKADILAVRDENGVKICHVSGKLTKREAQIIVKAVCFNNTYNNITIARA
jgi:hypothetical protein